MKHLKRFNESTGIELPQKIGHNYKPLRVIHLSELERFKNHRRLRVFYEKGCKCVNFDECGNEGSFLVEAVDKGHNKHIDLYTKDFDMMTIDHIKPKAKGGKHHDINNLQPMCEECNGKKADTYDDPEEIVKESLAYNITKQTIDDNLKNLRYPKVYIPGIYSYVLKYGVPRSNKAMEDMKDAIVDFLSDRLNNGIEVEFASDDACIWWKELTDDSIQRGHMDKIPRQLFDI